LGEAQGFAHLSSDGITDHSTTVGSETTVVGLAVIYQASMVSRNLERSPLDFSQTLAIRSVASSYLDSGYSRRKRETQPCGELGIARLVVDVNHIAECLQDTRDRPAFRLTEEDELPGLQPVLGETQEGVPSHAQHERQKLSQSESFSRKRSPA
jgi:hypothetical protein